MSNREWDVGASHRGRGLGGLVGRWGINVAVLGRGQSGSTYVSARVDMGVEHLFSRKTWMLLCK